jgi:hypothetical protein
MMGHRQRLIDGDEFDTLTRGGRRVHKFRSGVRKHIKRKVNKRARRGDAAVLDAAVLEAPGIEAITDEVEALLEAAF